MSAPATPLTDRLRRDGLEGCVCAYQWKPLGRLYGISMGMDWVRLRDEPECPLHGGTPAASDGNAPCDCRATSAAAPAVLPPTPTAGSNSGEGDTP